MEAYNLYVVQPPAALSQEANAFFRSEIFDRPFAKMSAQRMGFIDALVLDLSERTPRVDHFVTWNARHFKNKTSLNVLTPEEYLAISQTK